MSSKITNITVTDGRRRLKLEITQKDVKKSIKNDPAHCAAAVACQRILHAKEVRIYKTRAYIRIENRWTRYMVPPAIYREITAFDRGAQFEPGTYYLRPPGESEKLGKITTHSDTKKGKKRTQPIIMKTKNVRPDAKSGIAIYEELI